jgi:AcrR family transcriptional regulator
VPDAGDGRHRRRLRNADAVVDAVVSLWAEGELEPGAQAIADRSGVSLRSLFRYFEDLDALVATAVERHGGAQDHWFEPLPDHGSLDERLDRLVDHRLALHDALFPLWRAARLRAHRVPRIRHQGAARARQLRDQTAVLLAPELAAADPTVRRRALHALEVALDLESVDRLRVDRAVSRAGARAALRLLVDGAVAELR